MNPRVLSLLREAAEWRLISLLFEAPSDSWRRQMAQLSEELGDPELSEAVLQAMKEASGALYHTTFGPGGPAAPREVSYCSHVLPGQVMGEVTAYYRAFAYEPALREAPDHVAVESGFVAYLRLKEAYAVERGEADQAAVCADAARQFIADHLSAIAEPLATSLAGSGILHLAKASAALLHRTGPRRPMATLADTQHVNCAAGGGCSWVDEESS